MSTSFFIVRGMINWQKEEDLPFEEDLISNGSTLRSWLRYLEHKKNTHLSERLFVYERAVKALPESYKLWKQLLDLSTSQVKQVKGAVLSSAADAVNCQFERCLLSLSRMPRIWLDYMQFIALQRKISLLRRVLNNALRALPINQHYRIWDTFMRIMRDVGCKETVVKCYERYLQFDPSRVLEFIERLVEMQEYSGASLKLVALLNKSGGDDLWKSLIQIVVKHPKSLACSSIPPKLMEGIVESCLKHGQKEAGLLWASLASYYIVKRSFERARDVYERAMKRVSSVRDFTIVFDAYSKFEEAVITGLMERQGNDKQDALLEIDLRLARLEDLIQRRPFILNQVVLRQNPNNCLEWLNRINMFRQSSSSQVIKTFKEAIATIAAKKAVGSLADIWIEYAKEVKADVKMARAVFEEAIKVDYKNVNDLASVWIEYCEYEISIKVSDLLARAVKPVKYADFKDSKESVQNRVYKSVKLWNYYVDFEEIHGGLESVRCVYDRILELKIASIQTVLNYAVYLEDCGLIEDTFQVYERGLELFSYPASFEIWNVYLPKFLEFYGKAKIERARDLFEHALEGCPTRYCKSIYLLYAKMEEEFGLARNAMKIYDEACRKVDQGERYEMFMIYIERAGELFGKASVRPIFERAIEGVKKREAKDICMQYAALEVKLGEIERARAIYAHGSHFCDPKSVPGYWEAWQEFEVTFGNEDSFREMLRIKRSVQVQFADQINFVEAEKDELKDELKGAEKEDMKEKKEEKEENEENGI